MAVSLALNQCGHPLNTDVPPAARPAVLQYKVANRWVTAHPNPQHGTREEPCSPSPNTYPANQLSSPGARIRPSRLSQGKPPGAQAASRPRGYPSSTGWAGQGCFRVRCSFPRCKLSVAKVTTLGWGQAESCHSPLKSKFGWDAPSIKTQRSVHPSIWSKTHTILRITSSPLGVCWSLC